METLQPGETLIKDSGSRLVEWRKSRFKLLEGSLTLTNRRLIYQSLKPSVRARERVELSLGDITSVEKGLWDTIKITADRKYKFTGMSDAEQWVDLITIAVRDAKTAPSHAPPQPAYQSPPPAYTPPPPPAPQAAPAAQRPRFCTECGSPLDANIKFCGSCGKKL